MIENWTHPDVHRVARRVRRDLIRLLACFALVTVCRADYLIVSRTANLKEHHEGSAQPRQQLKEGDRLRLLEQDQTDGYYRAELQPSGPSGWVYRTYVRRYAGDPPQDSVSSPTPGGPVVSSAGLWDPIAPDSKLMRLHEIDVGQANAGLLEFPCGAILIDAGAEDDNYANSLVQYLDGFFARRTDLNRTIDTLLITHNHVDHTRALRAVAEHFKIRNFVENGQRGGSHDPGDPTVKWLKDNAASKHIHYRDVDDSDVISVAGRAGFTAADIDPLQCQNVDPQVRILSADIATADHPNWSESDFDNKNNHSVVIRVQFGQARFLFTGDLEEPAIETLVDYYRGTDALNSDVWLVGHHGSRNGTTQSVVDAISPDVAVISMGQWDRQKNWTAWAYGHPRADAINLLEAGILRRRETPKSVHIATAQYKFKTITMNAAIYGTGWDGTLIIDADASGNLRVGSADGH